MGLNVSRHRNVVIAVLSLQGPEHGLQGEAAALLRPPKELEASTASVLQVCMMLRCTFSTIRQVGSAPGGVGHVLRWLWLRSLWICTTSGARTGKLHQLTDHVSNPQQ